MFVSGNDGFADTNIIVIMLRNVVFFALSSEKMSGEDIFMKGGDHPSQ